MNVLRFLLYALLLQNAPPPPVAAPVRPPVGTAVVEGTVVRLGSNDPIAGADIELTFQTLPGAPVIPPYTATSGVDGKFTFRNVGAGTYKVVAARIGGGYTPFEFGQRGTLGRGVVFPVADGEQKKDIRLEMAATGSITGRILDADSRPVGHVAVTALSVIYRNGERIVTTLELVHSDDHGEYRLFSLSPGRYFVAVRLEDLTRRTVPLGYYPPGRMLASDQVESPVVTKRTLPTGDVVEETYQVLYYGGGLNPDLASIVDVGPGATAAGVDISIAQSKVPSLHIRGKVTGTPNATPVAGLGGTNGPVPSAATANAVIPPGTRIVAIPQRYASDMIVPTATADATGAFDMAGAVPGKYYLNALAPAEQNVRTNPPPPPQFGYVTIEVGEKDLDGQSIPISPGYNVSGKFVLEGRPDTDPILAKLRLDFNPEPWTLATPSVNLNAATFSPNGDFVIRNIPQWDFFPVVTGLPQNAYVKSMRSGNRDLLLTPLHVDAVMEGRMDVVVATDSSTLTGRVMDDRQTPAVNVKVVLVPDAPFRRRWDLYKTVATDQSGNFTLRTIAPGDYKVFAWEEVDDNIWTIPDFLRSDEGRGKAIHIGSSASEKIEVSVIPAKRR